jgi:hypothetical protein
MWRMQTLRASGAALVLGMAASSIAHSDEVAPPVKAVWQVQEIFLSYVGYTTFYSCDSFKDKVRSMVETLGAHESSMVATAGCTELTGPERFPGARLILATPRAATPEVLAANAKDEKRPALLAKLQRKGKPALDAGEFDAVRKVVALNIKEPGSLTGAGDCELVEHIRDKVVTKLDARIVKDEVSCTPHQATVGNRKLQVEVLTKR